MIDRDIDWPVLVVLGRSWSLCVRSRAALGAHIGGLGTYVGDLELLLGLYGRSWSALGAMLAVLGPLGTYVGGLACS